MNKFFIDFFSSVASTIILMLILLIFLSACSTVKPEPVVVVKTEYKLLKLPDRLLSKCNVSTPPDKQVYITSSYMKKEELLTNYILRLLTDIDNCNIKLLAIKDLQTKQENIYLKK